MGIVIGNGTEDVGATGREMEQVGSALGQGT